MFFLAGSNCFQMAVLTFTHGDSNCINCEPPEDRGPGCLVHGLVPRM